jgi:uncharacterized membrane protein YfcA
VHELWSPLVAGLAVLSIGLSKAGFGGGLGILTTPLCVLAFDAKSAIGIKLPFFCVDQQIVPWSWLPSQAIITHRTLLFSAQYFLLVPIGVWRGVWLNRKVSERMFVRLIYLFTFLMGLELMFNWAQRFR